MKFNHPFVAGIACSRLTGSKLLQRRFTKEFKKRRLPFVYLILKAEPRYLKNIITCMKLMDVTGINLSGRYQKLILPSLDQLHQSARDAKKANVIAKRGRRFIGYFVKNLIKDSVNLWSSPR